MSKITMSRKKIRFFAEPCFAIAAAAVIEYQMPIGLFMQV